MKEQFITINNNTLLIEDVKMVGPVHYPYAVEGRSNWALTIYTSFGHAITYKDYPHKELEDIREKILDTMIEWHTTEY